MMDYAGRVAEADTYPKLLRLNAREHGGEIAHPCLVVVPGEDAPEPEILFAQRDLAAMLFGVEAQQLWVGVGLGGAGGVIHHAALSVGAGTSSGSTRTSSSSPR